MVGGGSVGSSHPTSTYPLNHPLIHSCWMASGGVGGSDSRESSHPTNISIFTSSLTPSLPHSCCCCWYWLWLYVVVEIQLVSFPAIPPPLHFHGYGTARVLHFQKQHPLDATYPVFQISFKSLLLSHVFQFPAVSPSHSLLYFFHFH